MKDDLIERMARAIDAVQLSSRVDDTVSPPALEICRYGAVGEPEIVVIASFDARTHDENDALRSCVSRERARAVLEVARPAIRKEALEEAAKAIQCDCCDVCGESPDYEYVCANELAARIRALATTGQEGGRWQS